MQGLRIANGVVRRADKDFGAGVSLAGLQGCQCHCRRGVAATGLKQDIGINADVMQLFGYQEAMLLITDHNRA